MKRIAVLIADGSEEIETLTPVDVLRRAKAQVDLISVGKLTVACSRGVVVKADKIITEIDPDDYEGVVIPGGMPGATNIAENKNARELTEELAGKGKLVAAICASPAVVLAEWKLTDGKRITCYPAGGFIGMLSGADYTAKSVETDGDFITADGPRSAMEFALKICEYLNISPAF